MWESVAKEAGSAARIGGVCPRNRPRIGRVNRQERPPNRPCACDGIGGQMKDSSRFASVRRERDYFLASTQVTTTLFESLRTAALAWK